MSVYQKATGSCVLHITITHLIYPVTEEVLDQLFDVYGVHDLCVSQKSTHMEVFVEFQSCLEASQARGALHGRCIYDGCCLLDIQHTPPSISVITLPNSKPVVVDFDCVEMAMASIAIDVSSLAAPTPTTCSTECPSHDATAPTSALTSATTPTSVDIFPELAAPAVRDEAIDIDISVLELDTMVPTRCSTLCFDNDIGMRTPAFQLDVTPSTKQRGQMLRPSPWPSFIAEHTSTARSSIVKPPLSAATASSRDVVPYSALPPLPSTTWPRNEIRVKLCITALDVFLVSSYLDTVGSCAWLQVMVLDDISHEKGCQGELDLWWSHTQYVQPASTIFEAHSQLLEASEIFNTERNWGAELLSRDHLFGWYTELKTDEGQFYLVRTTHLDCLRPPAEPPDSSEGMETMLSSP